MFFEITYMILLNIHKLFEGVFARRRVGNYLFFEITYMMLFKIRPPSVFVWSAIDLKFGSDDGLRYELTVRVLQHKSCFQKLLWVARRQPGIEQPFGRHIGHRPLLCGADRRAFPPNLCAQPRRALPWHGGPLRRQVAHKRLDSLARQRKRQPQGPLTHGGPVPRHVEHAIGMAPGGVIPPHCRRAYLHACNPTFARKRTRLATPEVQSSQQRCSESGVRPSHPSVAHGKEPEPQCMHKPALTRICRQLGVAQNSVGEATSSNAGEPSSGQKVHRPLFPTIARRRHLPAHGGQPCMHSRQVWPAPSSVRVPHHATEQIKGAVPDSNGHEVLSCRVHACKDRGFELSRTCIEQPRRPFLQGKWPSEQAKHMPPPRLSEKKVQPTFAFEHRVQISRRRL